VGEPASAQALINAGGHQAATRARRGWPPTSAFNCRSVAATDHWSEHAYGRAIDLNRSRPLRHRKRLRLTSGRCPYADRSRRVRGLIHDGGAVVKAFAAVGWGWGGNWSWPKDYQHFSASGR
jgi:D-alanyl-D-alanine carboxypeptidase